MTRAAPWVHRRAVALNSGQPQRSRSVSARADELLIELDHEDRAGYLDAASEAFARDHATLSSKETFLPRQKRVAVAVLVVLVLLAIPFPLGVARLVAGLLTLVYAAAAIYRLQCFRLGLKGSRIIRVTDEDALAARDDALPRYTVLVPAYREPEVIHELLEHVEKLDYPRDKLEVLIMLEEDDPETLAAVREARPGDHVRVVVVPQGEVTTKPRACNYGLQLATGQFVTIYDAEDEPEPLQLRRAALAFLRLPEKVACLQARLSYFNANQNLITRWFAAEYLTWFNHFLPGLSALGSPIPLGGTSNHVRTTVLREVGGWDPYNVTEDADLGLRLARRGYEVDNLDSVTLEEANSDFINWVKQRSRWYKGYLQTWLVHMRSPRQLKREVGWRGVAGVNLFIGGTPILATLNPLFWVLSLLWFGFQPHWLAEVFGGPVYFLAMATWVIGNFAMVYMGLVSIKAVDRPELLVSTLIVPLYWIMMALAAIKATVQLVVNPSFWEKTTHGLGSRSKGPVDVTAA